MKKIVIPVIIVIALALGAKFFVFRGGPPPGMGGAMPPPVVETAKVSEIETGDKIKTTGRIESPLSVDIRPRVEGYLQKAYFEEGSFVKKGDLLFLIEPDTFEAVLRQAKADINETEAALEEAEKNFVRVQELVEKEYASKARYDDILAKRNRAKALLEVKKANLEQARINLGYTRIYAPVSGKIGKIQMHEGNVVSPLIGTLARIVSLNPVYVTYNITTAEYLKIIKDKKANTANEVAITLADESIYPSKGKVVFYDNEVDGATGTIAVRAELENPDYMLIPGQYVNVEMRVGKRGKTLAVPQEAVLDSPEGKYVYVMQEDSTVNPRPIGVKKQQDGYWTVTGGIEAGETIVVKGTQKVRPGIKVMDKDQVGKNAKE